MRKETQIINAALIAGFALGAAGCERASVPIETAVASESTNTVEIVPPVGPIETLSPEIAEVFPAIEPTPTPTEVPKSYEQFGVDFAKETKVEINLEISGGKKLKISKFTPLICDSDTDDSLFKAGNNRGCAYRLKNDSNDLILFVHSGWIDGIIKLEAEDIRHYIEDKTYDTRQPIDVIKKLMAKFIDAKVNIKQGKGETKELSVKAFVRIPPDKLGPFSRANDGSLTNENIIDAIIASDSSLAYLKNDGVAQMFVIFCGWKNPEEANLLGIPAQDEASEYNATRYILILGE